MKSSTIIAILLIAITSVAQAVTVPTVLVGNAGNPADSTGLGAVAYDYRIGTTEVTIAQYTEFLNAKATRSNGLGLYANLMGSSTGGITRSGAGTAQFHTSTRFSRTWATSRWAK